MDAVYAAGSHAWHVIWLFARHHGVLGVGLLIFLEEMGIPLPLPGNIILAYLGARAAAGSVPPLHVATTMTLASIAGSVVLYAIALRLGRPAVVRWGRYIGLEADRVARIERWFARYGAAAVFLGRLIPGLRTPTSAVAGIFGVGLHTFVLLTAFASFIWTLFWVGIGGVAGHNLRLEKYMSGRHLVFTLIFAGLCLLILPAVGVVNAARQRRREKRDAAAAGEMPAPEGRGPVEAGRSAR